MSGQRCHLCGETAAGETTICAVCERTYGPRVARLLARAESDPDFALACLANFPDTLRERFAALLGRRCWRPGAEARIGPGLRRAEARVDPKWLRAAN